MQIVQVKISELKPAEYNPRLLTEDAHKALTDSIKIFGIVDPIIANKHEGRENVVVGGHMRLKIAAELGMKEVPVYFVDLDLDKEKELNIRLNKNTGQFDYELLANNFDIDFLKDIGFSANDLGLDETRSESDGEVVRLSLRVPKDKADELSTKIEEITKSLGYEIRVKKRKL